MGPRFCQSLLSVLLLFCLAANAYAAAGPLACASPDFCPLYCGNVQPIAAPTQKIGGSVPKLVAAAVTIRHGARTTLKQGCFPAINQDWDCTLTTTNQHMLNLSAPTQDAGVLFRWSTLDGLQELQGACQYGQLITRGWEQQLENGRNVRARYNDILPKSYFDDPRSLFMTSDTDQRTIASGQALFAGAFPDDIKLQQQFGTRIVDWFISMNSLVQPGQICGAAASNSMAAAEATAVPQAILTSNSTLLNNTWISAGHPVLQNAGELLNAMGTLNDCLMPAVCENRQWPSSISKQDIIQIHRMHSEWQYSVLRQPDVAGYQEGPLLADIVDLFNEITTGKTPIKFSLFSGHDTTIIALLTMLGFPENEWPPYASLLSLELLQAEDSSFYVRAIFNGLEFKMTGCPSVLCPLATFKQSMASQTNGKRCGTSAPWSTLAASYNPTKAPQMKTPGNDNPKPSSSNDGLRIAVGILGGVTGILIFCLGAVSMQLKAARKLASGNSQINKPLI